MSSALWKLINGFRSIVMRKKINYGNDEINLKLMQLNSTSFPSESLRTAKIVEARAEAVEKFQVTFQ